MASSRDGTVGAVARRAGRRPDPSRADAIRAAAVDLLVEQGYEAITIDAIAARAAASKATAYRRWRSKADLVLDAVTSLRSSIVAPDTGTLAGDLERLCESLLGTPRSSALTVTQRLVSAMPRNPALAAAVSTHLIGPRRQVLTEVLDRAVARGEIPAGKDIGLLVSVIPALVIYQMCTTGQSPTPQLLRRIVAQVLLPAALAPAGDERSEAGAR